MSPGYGHHKLALSPRVAEDADRSFFQDGQTPRYNGALGGKNAYALAFGSSDLSKILLHNKG